MSDLTRATERLRRTLDRGRTNGEPVDDGEPGAYWPEIVEELHRTDFARMIAAYSETLFAEIGGDAFSMWVAGQRLDETADAGKLEEVAARMFYLVEEFDTASV